MLGPVRGDLGRMGHHHDLDVAAEARQPFAHRRGRGAADADIDLVEHQRRHRVGALENDLEREQETGELAARGDARQRARRHARIGRHLEMDTVDAMRRPFRLREHLDHGAEAGLVQFQRRKLGGDRGIERLGRLGAVPAQGLGGFEIGGTRLVPPRGEAVQGPRRLIEPGEVGLHLLAQRGQRIDGDVVLARRRAEREQPFLHRLQPARVGVEFMGRRLQQGVGLGGGVLGAIERLDDGVEPPARPFRLAREHPSCRAETGLGTIIAAAAADVGERRRHRLGQLLAVHQHRAHPGKLVFLARPGIEGGQLAGDVTQIALLRPGLRKRRLGRLDGGQGPAQRLMAPHDFVAHIVEAAVAVEGGAVGGRRHQAVAREPALDLDQGLADAAQQGDAHRLVVDEGAAASVGAEHPP